MVAEVFMGGILTFNKRTGNDTWVFEKEVFKETAVFLPNPGRGWYQVYAFDAAIPIDENELQWSVSKQEQLIFMQLDIGRFRSQPISEEALSNIERIFNFFRREKKEVILRVVYDTIGRGIEKEPSFLSQVKDHIWQIGPIIERNANVIYTTQGVFVGNWGEMHGSKFLKQETLKDLIHTYLEATAQTCFLAVRRPVHWRTVFRKEIFREMPEDNLPEWVREHMTGLFDDGMLASDSDLGTFGTQKKSAVGWWEPWTRKEELEFEEKLCRHLPNGGEAVWGERLRRPREVIDTLKKMHISYLNGVYDGKVLSEWRKTSCEVPGLYRDANLHTYIGLHLGYRFVLRKLTWNYKKDRRLVLEIENVGFANIHEEAWVYLLLRFPREERKIFIETDVRMWDSGRITAISKEIPPLAGGEYLLYLGMNRKKDGRIIYFANEGATDSLYLGRLTVIGEGENFLKSNL
jgi:hypothetical protein